MDRSSAEPRNVKIDQLVGFMAGSMARYCFRTSGVDVAMKAGIEEVRKVIGIKCVGVRYAGDSVLTVASNDLGSCDDGVRMSRVLAASIGARIRAESAVAAVVMRTVAVGDTDARTAESDMPVAPDRAMSFSAMPKTAARKLRKNVSKVRRRTL